jgi:outer membrane protein insertion porin family
MTFEKFGKTALLKHGRNATLALAFLLSSGVAFAQSVVVQGNKRVSTDTIRSYAVDQPAAEVQKELMQTGLFSSVNVSKRGNQTVITVKENDTINRVAFEGNKKIKSEQLIPDLQTKARGPINQQAIDADVQRIREIYQRTGRGLAQVSARLVPLPNGTTDVVFTVNEGDKTGVKSIEFVGNNAYSARTLRDVMSTTESNFLSWLKTSDVYDPDKIAADEELIRRFYLKNGYADFRIVSTNTVFDPQEAGYKVVITVDEGRQYKVGSVSVDSRIKDIQSDQLRSRSATSEGSVYNAEQVEKTLQAMTQDVASKGYAFAQVRPQGQRDPETGKININYVVEEGPRVYVERINIRGNTRTRDYVIRRELDVGEGDAYNKIMVDRAERRLNNLGYFSKVRITNEPGSTPDRVIINVDVDDKPTGQFSIAGGYSTSDGFIGEVAISESNFLGRGQYVRLSGTYGQYSQGIDFSFTEPFFMDQRLAAGFDLFAKYSDNTLYTRYANQMLGGTLRMGIPLTEEISALIRYSAYQQKITIPNTVSTPYNDCFFPIPGFTALQANGSTIMPGNPGFYSNSLYTGCADNGEASMAVKEAQGTTFTSLAGYTLAYNTLNNNKNPTGGWYAELKQDFAGLGGDAKYIRTSGEARYYQELMNDVVGFLKVQGGYLYGYGDQNLRIVDNFFMGPNLVRGFAPAGIGPRDITVNPQQNALGGTTYFGGTAEVQFPIYGIPKEFGMRGAVFADAGTLFGYEGQTNFANKVPGATNYCPPAGSATTSWTYQPTCINVIDSSMIRSAVGVSLLWTSPLGPIRFDWAYPLSKQQYDQTQYFRFSGGTSF